MLKIISKGLPFLMKSGVILLLFLFAFPVLLSAQNTGTDTIPADSMQPVIKLPAGKGGQIPADTAGKTKYINKQEIINEPDQDATAEPAIKKQKKEEITVVKAKDTIQLRPHNPRTAAWMSAGLPGLGQIYNRKYWKLPIIYVGLGLCGYFVYTNTVQYRKYKETYLYKFGIDSTATDYFPDQTANTVKEYKEYHHKNIEISYIIAGAIYLLNIVDATVDAHLYNFDVGNDLTLRIEPSYNSLYTGFGNASGPGLKLTLKF